MHSAEATPSGKHRSCNAFIARRGPEASRPEVQRLFKLASVCCTASALKLEKTLRSSAPIQKKSHLEHQEILEEGGEVDYSTFRSLQSKDPATYYGHHEAEFGMSWCAGFSGPVVAPRNMWFVHFLLGSVACDLCFVGLMKCRISCQDVGFIGCFPEQGLHSDA